MKWPQKWRCAASMIPLIDVGPIEPGQIFYGSLSAALEVWALRQGVDLQMTLPEKNDVDYWGDRQHAQKIPLDLIMGQVHWPPRFLLALDQATYSWANKGWNRQLTKYFLDK